MIVAEISRSSMLFLAGIAFLSLFCAFILSVFDFSFRAVNRFIIELDSIEGEKYSETLNCFYKNREYYNKSIYSGRGLFVFLFVITSSVLFKITIVFSLIVFISLLLFVEIFPRVGALLFPGFFVEKMYLPVKANYLFFKKILVGSGVEKGIAENAPGEVEDSVENEEMEIFKNALNLPEVKLKECLIPRTEICAVPVNISREDLVERFIETKYSRILVYEGSIDKITGYIHTRDLLTGNIGDVRSLLRPIEFFPEEMSAKELLSRMIKKRSTVCVVLDEYGGTSGMVTLEDIIEEIFGEIKDELDKEELQERKVGDKEYIFSGRLEVKYLNKEYGFYLPEGEEYETLGGLITFVNENIPGEGEKFAIEGYLLKVLKIRNNSIASVYVRIIG